MFLNEKTASEKARPPAAAAAVARDGIVKSVFNSSCLPCSTNLHAKTMVHDIFLRVGGQHGQGLFDLHAVQGNELPPAFLPNTSLWVSCANNGQVVVEVPIRLVAAWYPSVQIKDKPARFLFRNNATRKVV